MHMADALISPEVGGAMWVASVATIAYSARRVKKENDDRKIPLMGILGAFIFAAQMINFTIPGTGSSGHLGGGMMLAILLGPHPAFLVMASILTVQALFFADGGILALGCNMFNLGFFPCYIAYPLIYKRISGDHPVSGRIFTGSILSVMLALLMGAFFVVVQTVLSGISELPFLSFISAMIPIHAAIAVIEGVITGIIVNFLWRAEPEILLSAGNNRSPLVSMRKILITLIILTALIGGGISWFASTHPDGLEWSIQRITGKEELQSPARWVHSFLARVQERISFLPDYNFKGTKTGEDGEKVNVQEEESWPAVRGGTTVSGLVGGAVTLLIVGAVGMVLKRRKSDP